MKPGELFKLDYINGHCRDINRRTGIYLGINRINRTDGVVIENHKVLLVGESTPTIIDKGLLRWITVIK